MNRGNEIKLTLWGPVADEIDDNLFKRNPWPFIIVATCLTVKTIKGQYIVSFICMFISTLKKLYVHFKKFLHINVGEYNLSSTSETKVYINLEIPKTSMFMDQ